MAPILFKFSPTTFKLDYRTLGMFALNNMDSIP